MATATTNLRSGRPECAPACKQQRERSIELGGRANLTQNEGPKSKKRHGSPVRKRLIGQDQPPPGPATRIQKGSSTPTARTSTQLPSDRRPRSSHVRALRSRQPPRPRTRGLRRRSTTLTNRADRMSDQAPAPFCTPSAPTPLRRHLRHLPHRARLRAERVPVWTT